MQSEHGKGAPSPERSQGPEQQGPTPDNRETPGIIKDGFPKPEQMIDTLEANGLQNHVDAYRKVLEIATAMQEAGGRALLVGGSVRDNILGKTSKDFDIEVYGLEAEQIEEVMKTQGKVSEVGKAFGILKLFLENGMEIDVSLPRTDSKTGEGHKGFAVKTDPHMTVEDAARRRDFTMNALAADPMTGELFDHFGGVEDINRRRLRVTDPERFKDDPLRVLRALQFVGRFGMEIDGKSIDLIREMVPDLKELPKERIGEEWKKLLLKSEKPSLGLAAGMALGVYQEIAPEFPPLAETPQEPEWHPEGDVWVHTLMSVDEAAKIARQEELDDRESLTLLLASLCHDIGKPMVTEFVDGRIRSIGHEPAGAEPTKKFLGSIGIDSETRDKAVKLVANHLIPSMFYGSEVVKGEKISDGAIRRLAKRIDPATIRELVLVAKADHLGRGPFTDAEITEQMLMPPDRYPAAEWLLERARKLEIEDSKPKSLTRGKDWIRLGYKPGPQMGELIRLADDLRDELGWSREQIFAAVHETQDPKKAIEILQDRLETEK